MKVRHSKDPYPRNWAKLPGADKAILIGDVKVTPYSRLRMKLLVFKSRRDLRAFWKQGLGTSLIGPRMLGVVSDLACEVIHWPGGRADADDRYLEVDPTFFAVMGLLTRHLTVDVITHECVHAGLAYVSRSRGGEHWSGMEHPDERLCYPIGRLACGVNRLLREAKLIP